MLLKLASKEERLQIIEKIIKYNLNVERTEQAIEDFIEKCD